MAQAVPPVPRGLAYDLTQFLEALRLAVGGNSAITAPTTQAVVLAPVSATVQVAAELSPVPLSVTSADLAPVGVCPDGDSGLEPI